jgi:hypothetical protein
MISTCAHLSNRAYDRLDDATFISSEDTGAQAFCWSNCGTQYIVFRGTSELSDLATDFDIRRISFHGTRVHRGFRTQYRSIAESIRSNISSNATSIVCTGHSLGGALATLAAIDLATPGKTMTCCTFGCPRVGDEAMTKLFKERVHTSVRLFHEYDPISMVPVTTRFMHVHGGYKIGADTLVRSVESDGGFWKRLCSLFRRHDLDYHSMNLYALHAENLNLHT